MTISLRAGYTEYEKLWNYRRLHPEILPTRENIELSAAGHTHTYADTLWIQLIQYIADNIGNDAFADSLTPIIERISELHPRFSAPYNLTLLLAPAPNTDLPHYESDRKQAQKAYDLGKIGLTKICDTEKLEQIRSSEVGKRLWDRSDLKNPCTDGMVPYYLAAVASNLGEFSEAAEYYKIASMQSDGPEASRFLSVLMQSEEGNYHDAAIRFFLIAVDGYDEGSCAVEAVSLIQKYRDRLPENESDILGIEAVEKNLTAPKDTKNPLSQSSTSCYASTNRGIKALYLGYINTKAQKNPTAKTAKDLIQSGTLSSIPTPISLKGFTVIKQKNGIWEYRNN